MTLTDSPHLICIYPELTWWMNLPDDMVLNNSYTTARHLAQVAHDALMAGRALVLPLPDLTDHIVAAMDWCDCTQGDFLFTPVYPANPEELAPQWFTRQISWVIVAATPKPPPLDPQFVLLTN
jgi:hypothetical protein